MAEIGSQINSGGGGAEAPTDAEGEPTADQPEEEETEIPDYSDLVSPEFQEGVYTPPGLLTTPPATGAGSFPFPGPGTGVIVTPGTMGTPSQWPVFVPGVIPGLPQSNTVIGTVQDVLNNPSQVLNDLLEDLEGIVTNPQEAIEQVLNGVADETGIITVGAIREAVTRIQDIIQNPPSPIIEAGSEGDSPLIPGGAGVDDQEDTDDIIAGDDDDDDEIIAGDDDDDDEIIAGEIITDDDEIITGEIITDGIETDDIFTEEGQTTDYGGGLNDGETEDILAGIGGATAAAAAGTGVQRPTGDFTPFMRRLQYTPVAVPKAIVPSAPIVSSLFSEYFK